MKDIEGVVKFPVYGYEIVLISTKNIIESRIKRNEEIGYPFVKKEGDVMIDGLHCHKETSQDSFIFLHPRPSINSLSHECYHAISRMFELIGSEHEEELFAYHLGYLIEKAYNSYYNVRKRTQGPQI